MEKLLSESLFFWKSLTDNQKNLILNNTINQKIHKNTITHHSTGECTGLEVVKSGQVRVFMNSPNGGEITLYRLLEGDVCIVSAACMVKSLDLEIMMEFEKDSEILIIPTNIYEKINEENPKVKDFTLELISGRFSEVMWIMNQLVFSNMGSRLAAVLLERSQLDEKHIITVTHDIIAKDLGTAREVVTRLLKQFQQEGLVKLSRGNIEILDEKRLQEV